MAQHIDHFSCMMDEEISRYPALSPSPLPMLGGRAPAQKMDTPQEPWRSIFDSVACGLIVWNTAERSVEVNKAAQQILDGKLAEMQQVLSEGAVGLACSDGISLAPVELLISRLLASGEAQYGVLEDFTRPDGAKCWLQLDAVPVYGEDRAIREVIVTFQDVTERVQTETTLHEREQLFSVLTEQSNDLTQIIDATGRFKYISPSHRQILGYAPEDLLGMYAFSLFHSDDVLRMHETFADCLEVNGSLVRAEYRLRHADGSWLTMDGVVHNCLENPAVNGVVITARDITERVAMEQELRYQAHYDGLTGLSNSTKFIDLLDQAVQVAAGQQHTLAVLVLDVDRFKDVNDTFGHDGGDLLLQEVGMRLQQIIPESSVASRLSGDEFAVLLQGADEEKVQAVAVTIQRTLEEPCRIDGYPVQIDASIGGVLYPTHAKDGLTLLRRADMAMYVAKQAHEGYALFEEAFEQHTPRRLGLIADLRRAITTDELTLYYQPKVNLGTGSVSCVEALVRWQHPAQGLIPPDEFIPLAEQTGLIKALTRWVLEEAVGQCGTWLRAGRELGVAVNLSAWDLRDVKLPERVAALLECHAVPARLLSIELTESSVMTDMRRSLDILAQLFALGVSISIDDFGTGYSSLAYLKRLPVNELKIDRSFVQQLSTSVADATIVRTMVELAHSFGLRVVAEGIEDRTVLDMLTAFHCDLAQGYYFSRPLPVQHFEQWLQKAETCAARAAGTGVQDDLQASLPL